MNALDFGAVNFSNVAMLIILILFSCLYVCVGTCMHVAFCFVHQKIFVDQENIGY